jgi:drug/metabolite transporter (DMT)-like permease
MRKQHLTLKVFLLISLTVVIEAFADMLMKRGLASTGVPFIGINNIWQFISANIFSILIWLGVLLYLVNFILWLTALREVELSIIYPVGSTSYLIVPVVAIIFLHEVIPILRWFGIASIIAGIFFIARSQKGVA